jgi:hypothetical protein
MTKRFILWTAAVFLLVGVMPSLSAAGQGRDRDGDRVCFYQDIHFNGWEQCYYPGDEVIDLRDRKNAISSIRVFGRARVIIYDESQFRGPSLEINSDVADLDLRNMSGSRSWNDRIDSIRIAAAFPPLASARGRGFDDRFDRRDGICVFENANFRGRSQCFDSGVDMRELRDGNWNDRISSIQVVGNARAMLYENVGFRGERLVVDRDISDLAVIRLRDGMTWNDQASSLEVREDRGRGRGPNRR